jgi:hypothetical protein
MASSAASLDGSRDIAACVNGYEMPSGLPLPNDCKHGLAVKISGQSQ